MLTVPDDGKAIDSQYFRPSDDVKICTHGWLSGESTGWLQNIKNSFLKKDYNVILVDWSELADNPIYPLSALSTRYVGRRIAKLITALERTFHVGGESFHLIGHSLGAQVMGYAGMFSKQQIKRITGESDLLKLRNKNSKMNKVFLFSSMGAVVIFVKYPQIQML